MKIVLVDCYNLGHIAFHSMGDLDYHGRRTGVIFGFLNKILLMAKTFETGRFVFAWDSRQSLRKLMYEPYKEREHTTTRGTDEIMDYTALHAQMDDLADNVLRSLGFTNVLLRAGFEADDMIAAAIKYGVFHPDYMPPGEPVEFIIASTDRDLYQLLAPNVSIYKIRSKATYTLEDFKAEYNIEPRQWVTAKAMGGCDSDHVAGIDGIADPAKSERSRALQIIRGELKKGRYVDAVNSPLGQLVIERNRLLVNLPFAPFNVGINMDHCTAERFIAMFDMLGFTSFLTPNQKWNEWEEYFGLNTERHKTISSKRLGFGR